MNRAHTVTALALTAVACGPKAGSRPAEHESTAIANEASATDEPAVPAWISDGALWSCRISDYDPQPCMFSQDGGAWSLRKLLGSQRFKGAVTFPDDRAIAFDGEFFCPWGGCTEPMRVTFQMEREGRYVTAFSGDPITVEWNQGYADEWGGAGYGALTGDEM